MRIHYTCKIFFANVLAINDELVIGAWVKNFRFGHRVGFGLGHRVGFGLGHMMELGFGNRVEFG